MGESRTHATGCWTWCFGKTMPAPVVGMLPISLSTLGKIALDHLKTCIFKLKRSIPGKRIHAALDTTWLETVTGFSPKQLPWGGLPLGLTD